MKKEEILKVANEHKNVVVELMRDNGFSLLKSELYYDSLTETYNLFYLWIDNETGVTSHSLYVYDKKYMGCFTLCILEKVCCLDEDFEEGKI